MSRDCSPQSLLLEVYDTLTKCPQNDRLWGFRMLGIISLFIISINSFSLKYYHYVNVCLIALRL